MNKRIYLSSPHMGGTELNYVQDAFDSNWISPLGPNVDEFELQLENYFENKRFTAALSSGTSALHLALILLGVGKEDEVICQSMTFSASANPIIYQGATPVFIDSEKNTWNMDPDLLEEAIRDRIGKGKKPKAIIAVHLYGMPFNVDEIVKIANTYEIPLIEDAAEALGSTFREKKCGSFGTFGVLSFNGNKIITTSGGGALVTSNFKSKEEAIFLATQARDSAPHYEHSRIGYNYRLSNVSAGIGRGQMEVLQDHVLARRIINEFYRGLFKDIEGIEVFREPSEHYYSNHWLTCILIEQNKAKITPTELRLELERKNIESRPLWKPMHLQPIFKDYPYYGSDVSSKLFDKGLCLPSGSNLSTNELNRIQQTLQNCL